MNDKIRIGVIGVGQIGKHHLNVYQKIPEAEVVAICDIDDQELSRVSGVYNIHDTYHFFRDLLKRDDIQAVDVCLHNNLHMPVTVAALEAGKNVYCEKPMAGTYIDARTMYETARAKGLKLSIQLNTLFSEETKAAKALIDQGMLGKIYHARSTGHRRRGRPYVDGYGSHFFVQKEVAAGGAMYDMGVYHIANLLYLLGNPKVVRATGKTYQELEMNETRRAFSNYSVEELGLGFIFFENDLTMDIIESWAVNVDQFEGSSLLGSKGGIRLEPFGFFQTIGDLDLDTKADLENLKWRLHSVHLQGASYDSAQQHWIAALLGRVPLLPTAELALNTMLISEAIYLSNRLGKEVVADEVVSNSVSTAFKL